MDSAQVQTEKLELYTETQIEKPVVESSKKPSEIQIEKPKQKQVETQVQTKTVPPAKTKKPKPLFVEMQTQTDLPEIEPSKVITATGSMDIVRTVGHTSGTFIA